MKYEDAKARLQEVADLEIGGVVGREDVARIEAELGTPLPASYQRYLEDFGWIATGPHELMGTGPGIPPFLDVVRVTRSERSEAVPALPRELIPLMNDGGGNLYCLDTGQMVGDECPVVFWSHVSGKSEQPEADDFPSWLARLVATA